MKPILSILTAAFILVGCTTPISDTTLARIESVSQAAASVGVAADLVANNEHRPFIVAIKTQLDAQIATGRITSGQLAAIIVDKLPLDSQAAQYFNGALVLWGITSAWWIAPNADDASMRVAIGLSRGISIGLTAVPTSASRGLVMPPQPTSKNVRAL